MDKIESAARKKAIEAIDNSKTELAELARFIHAHPELGFQERESSAAVVKVLENHGFKIERKTAGIETAFIARSINSGVGPKIAFLAEYDALPGLGHACGHNLIAAASVGAAIGASKAFDNIPGEILCIGTPAEEGGGGKVLMANAGVFNGLDAVMMTHPYNQDMVFKKALGVVTVNLRYLGKSAHAAAEPEKGINALDAMVLFFSGVNAMRQQFPKYVRVHGIITHGGDAPNIIPERTEAVILVRALSEKVLDEMLVKVENIARAAATSTGCRLEFNAQCDIAYAPFNPNHALGNIFKENLESLGVNVTQGPEDEGMGSSDVGNVSRVAPIIHPEFAICSREVGNHMPEFAAAAGTDKAIDKAIVMAKAMALTAVTIFERPELLNAIRAEFDMMKKGD